MTPSKVWVLQVLSLVLQVIPTSGFPSSGGESGHVRLSLPLSFLPGISAPSASLSQSLSTQCIFIDVFTCWLHAGAGDTAVDENRPCPLGALVASQLLFSTCFKWKLSQLQAPLQTPLPYSGSSHFWVVMGLSSWIFSYKPTY